MSQNNADDSKEIKSKGVVKGVPGNERIAALSDGVFAIVITLLVLEIKVPEVETTELSRALLETAPKILSHIVSFVVLGIYWVGHHNVFQHIKRHDRVLLWLNIFFLLSVASMPFPTGLIVQYPDQRSAIIVYAAALIVGGFTLDLIWKYATKDHRLVNETMKQDFINSVHRRILVAPLFYLLAIALSFVNVLLSYLIIIGVIVYYIVPLNFDSLHHFHIHGHSKDNG
jgi:uncharacterized membrane protein